jgi:hypothetical protein
MRRSEHTPWHFTIALDNNVITGVGAVGTYNIEQKQETLTYLVPHYDVIIGVHTHQDNFLVLLAGNHEFVGLKIFRTMRQRLMYSTFRFESYILNYQQDHSRNKI